MNGLRTRDVPSDWERPLSFSVFINWFANGEPDWISTDELRRVFGKFLASEDEFGWRLSFGPQLDSDVYLRFGDDDTTKVCGLSVDRPSSAPAMWTALYELLGVGNAVFYFPGSGLYTRLPNAAHHLPRDMLDALGDPKVVMRPDALPEAIESA